MSTARPLLALLVLSTFLGSALVRPGPPAVTPGAAAGGPSEWIELEGGRRQYNVTDPATGANLTIIEVPSLPRPAPERERATFLQELQPNDAAGPWVELVSLKTPKDGKPYDLSAWRLTSGKTSMELRGHLETRGRPELQLVRVPPAFLQPGQVLGLERPDGSLAHQVQVRPSTEVGRTWQVDPSTLTSGADEHWYYLAPTPFDYENAAPMTGYRVTEVARRSDLGNRSIEIWHADESEPARNPSMDAWRLRVNGVDIAPEAIVYTIHPRILYWSLATDLPTGGMAELVDERGHVQDQFPLHADEDGDGRTWQRVNDTWTYAEASYGRP